MAEREEKYIVVKIKDLKEYEFEIESHWMGDPMDRGRMSPEGVKEAKRNIVGFHGILDVLNNKNKYLVINLDEPYAEPMWDILIAFENLKEEEGKT